MSALALNAEALYGELLRGVRSMCTAETRLVGITSGGAWLAERLQKDLGLSGKHGSISSAIHRDDFVHVALTELQDYDKPVVVKVYDADNIHLHIELNILKHIVGFRNTPLLICDFSCNDDTPLNISNVNRSEHPLCPNIHSNLSTVM